MIRRGSALLGCFITVFCISKINTAQVIGKNDNTCFFTQEISDSVLDRFNGKLYLSTTGDSDFSLAKSSRNSCQFCPLAQNNLLSGKDLAGLSLLARDGQETTDIATFFKNTESQSNQIAVRNQKSNTVLLSGELYDAIGNVGQRVSDIASSKTCVFARVVSTEVNLTTGDATNSSINTIQVEDPFALTIVDGSISTNGVLLDVTSNQAKIGANLTALEVLDLHWDECLETLYIALRVVVDSTAGANNTGYSLIKGTIDNTCALTLLPITTAVPNPGSLNTLFSYQNDGTEASDIEIIAYNIRVMKTSSGLNYLIVNGNISTNPDTVGNCVFALPLGKKDSAIPGCIAQNILTSNEFETPLLNNFDHLTGCPIVVGNEPAPWAETINASDMVVVGDTIYVSVVVPGGRDNINDPGVWSSQAMFDAQGKIVSWTKWQRAFPSEGGGEFSTRDNTPHFAVDAKTAQLWRVREDGIYAAPENYVLRTAWAPCKRDKVGLAKAVSLTMKDGIFTFLDLPQDTPGLASVDNPHLSLVLFGGFEKVLFARPKFGLDNHVTATHEFISELEQFENQNIKLTDKRDGLDGVGCIRSLGYSYNNENLSKGFFFAGTDRGLYAYARSEETGQPGEGFNGSLGLSQLDDFPFENLSFPGEPERGSFPGNTWQRVAQNTITKCMTVPHIASDGQRIYFTTFDSSCDVCTNSSDMLFAMEITENIPDMIPRKIAQSGIAGIPSNTIFTGFTIFTTSDNPYNNCGGNTYYGLISTNDGIYTSTTDLRHLVMPNSGQEWSAVENTKNLAFNFLDGTSKDITNNRKALGIYFVNANLNCSFDRSRFIQLGNNNGNQAMSGEVRAIPDSTNNNANDRRFYTNKSPIIDILDYSLSLWSDGARRLFTGFSLDKPCIKSSLASLPFDAAQWNMQEPCIELALDCIDRVHFIGDISANGQVVIGTDCELIALE